MPVRQTSIVKARVGNRTELPTQLSNGAFGWAQDTKELYIGNGTPHTGNTKILTQFDPLGFSFGSLTTATLSPRTSAGNMPSDWSFNSTQISIYYNLARGSTMLTSGIMKIKKTGSTTYSIADSDMVDSTAGIVFSVTTGGQVQYTLSGSENATIKYQIATFS